MANWRAQAEPAPSPAVFARSQVVHPGHTTLRHTSRRDDGGETWSKPVYIHLKGWANNDLILRSMGRDGKWEDRVITPPLSFVSWLPARTKKLVAAGDKLYVFSTGQKKVGKLRETYGYKNQIFFVKMEV